jgi:hypothetical protein
MADLVPSLIHLTPPGSLGAIRLDRFSPNFEEADARGFVNVRPLRPYRHIYPFDERDLSRLVPWFDFDYADGRDPARYATPLRRVVDVWRSCHETSRLEITPVGGDLRIEDTRPGALDRSYLLTGAARLAYQALDAGNTVPGVLEQLRRDIGDEAPARSDVERWLDEWLAARLVMREGPLFLSLATNPNELVRRPLDRLMQLLAR